MTTSTVHTDKNAKVQRCPFIKAHLQQGFLPLQSAHSPFYFFCKSKLKAFYCCSVVSIIKKFN
jgi:hypothetical protein